MIATPGNDCDDEKYNLALVTEKLAIVITDFLLINYVLYRIGLLPLYHQHLQQFVESIIVYETRADILYARYL